MARQSSTAKLIESDFATPDLQRIRRFILESIAEGAIAALVYTIMRSWRACGI